MSKNRVRRLRRRTALTGVLSVLVATTTILISMPSVASADTVLNNNEALESLWTYYTSQPCVEATSLMSVPEYYPIDTWGALTGSAEDGGSVSVNASVGGGLGSFLATVGISYTPKSECEDQYPVNTGDIIEEGFLWYDSGAKGARWGLCATTPGSPEYGPGVTTNQDVAVVLSAGGLLRCGSKGWYSSCMDSEVYQNNTYNGWQRYCIYAAQDSNHDWWVPGWCGSQRCAGTTTSALAPPPFPSLKTATTFDVLGSNGQPLRRRNGTLVTVTIPAGGAMAAPRPLPPADRPSAAALASEEHLVVTNIGGLEIQTLGSQTDAQKIAEFDQLAASLAPANAPSTSP